jgi:hypothetical protein
MSNWNLTKVLEGIHDEIHQKLTTTRNTFEHSVTKGDTSEKIWLDFLQRYLPQRYQVEKAFVVDSMGNFSEQIDVVIFDRQYSPFIFNFEGSKFVPAESIYAVFEAKQTINLENVLYAHEKIKSVRCLHRTSLRIPHAGGYYEPKPSIKIIGGILTLESDWKPGLGEALENALIKDSELGRLNLGCVASHGYFVLDEAKMNYNLVNSNKPAPAFLFKLISELQASGTVPMIDVLAYSKWLTV